MKIEDLKVGMYVRTFDGRILKVTQIVKDTESDLKFYSFEGDYMFGPYRKRELKRIVKEASENIIDLIEVGDYVNGKKVIRKWEEPTGAFVGQTFIQLEGEETIPTMRKIETIVTKEQYEQMSIRWWKKMSDERILEILEKESKYFVLGFIKGIKAKLEGLRQENQQLKIQISAREEEYKKLEDKYKEVDHTDTHLSR